MKLRTLFIALAGVLALSACGAPMPPQTEATAAEARETEDILENATTITMKKEALSLGDEWAIKVGGEEVATMEGLDLPALGDVYTILSPTGGFIAGEEEKILNISSTADFYDSSMEPTGTLKKKVLSFNAEYKLTDIKGEPTAVLNQKFALGFKATIKDARGREAWKVSRKFGSIGASLKLERANDTGVSALDAIRMVAVANEVYEAQAKK